MAYRCLFRMILRTAPLGIVCMIAACASRVPEITRGDREIAVADSLIRETLRKRAEYAALLAGCFHVRDQVWTVGTLQFPERFELRTDSYDALGYHYLVWLETSIPPTSEGDYPAAWMALSQDSAWIDLSPSISGAFHLSILAFSEGNQVRIKTVRKDPDDGTVVGRAFALREPCPEKARGIRLRN